MKRGYLIPVVLIIFLVSSAAWAQYENKAGVIGTKHDINSLGCKSCHAAHDGSASPYDLPPGGNPASGKVLLWDRNFSQTSTFGTYTSPTLTSTVTELSVGAGQIPASTDPRQNSLLCMSCHDGLTSQTVMASSDVMAIGSTTSLGLTNDHPVNMAYNPTLNPSLQPATSVTGTYVSTSPNVGGLTLPGGTVQCSSCHGSHDNTYTKFLRKPNTGSALCLTCHK